MANEFLRNRQDAVVNPAAKALPAAPGSIQSDPIDLGPGSNRGLKRLELEIQAPALNTTELPDTETTTYDMEHSDTSGSGYVDLALGVAVQTGASGAGAVAQKTRFGLPGDVKRFVNVKATSSATAGDQSGKTVALVAMF